MHRPVLVIAFPALTALLGGCGSFLPGHVGGLAAYVSPDDYAERLCANIDLESYPSCVSHVLDYFEEPHADDVPRGESNAGPIAVVMDHALYLGRYQWAPFKSSFRVVSGTNACRGSYSAFAGSRAPIYDVYCDDGRAGWADAIHDQSGRNGIGQLTLSDGTKGDIVFGYLALGQARPYPWGDVWRPPVTPATTRKPPTAMRPVPLIGIETD